MGGGDDKEDKANSPPDSAGTPDPAAETDKNTMDKDNTDEMDMDEARPEATLTYKVSLLHPSENRHFCIAMDKGFALTFLLCTRF